MVCSRWKAHSAQWIKVPLHFCSPCQYQHTCHIGSRGSRRHAHVSHSLRRLLHARGLHCRGSRVRHCSDGSA